MTTGDGSKTIHMPEWNEQYHSKHGALQEAQHVFIKMGLRFKLQQEQNDSLRILEYGFGTGLNALLTILEQDKVPISYTGLEKYPISHQEVEAMDYGHLLKTPDLFYQEVRAIVPL